MQSLPQKWKYQAKETGISPINVIFKKDIHEIKTIT